METIDKVKQMIANGVLKQEDAEKYFPELKESDERIRKGLIQYFSTFTLNTFAGLDPKKILSWLEKQREKPAGKVEPKFHEGDCAVSNLDGKTRRISEVHYDEYNNYYVVDGNSVNLEEYDRLHHIWTIQDAKDGDVLVASDKTLFIYNGNINENGNAGFYLALIEDMNIILDSDDGCGWEEKGSCYSATKEQRDTLFAKIKDAGYEWDTEKKELKKIEQKPVEWSKPGHKQEWSEEDENINQSIIDILTKQGFQTQVNWLKSLKDRVHLKQEWKQEDEKYWSIVIAEFSKCAGKSVSKDEWMRCNDWLNSLRDRVQPVQEWSEEDRWMIKTICSAFEKGSSQYIWLKSLRPRSHWKPSDAQMERLYKYAEQNNYELKKLKENIII